MPHHTSAHKDQFQNFISMFTVDSFFHSLLEVHSVGAWFNSSPLFPMTTTSLNVLLPGIEKYYGPNLPVNIHWQILDLGQFKSLVATKELDCVTDLQLQFWVQKSHK